MFKYQEVRIEDLEQTILIYKGEIDLLRHRLDLTIKSYEAQEQTRKEEEK